VVGDSMSHSSTTQSIARPWITEMGSGSGVGKHDTGSFSRVGRVHRLDFISECACRRMRFDTPGRATRVLCPALRRDSARL
jgi:hypothetical protein